MNGMKKLLALALAAALSVTLLTGCGGGEKPAPAPEEETPAVEQVDLSVLTGPVEYVSGLTPDTVIGSVGEHDIPAQELMYWFNYMATLTVQQMYYAGQTELDWAQDVGDGRTVGDVVLDTALELAAYYTLMPAKAQSEYGLTPDQELLDTVMEELTATEEYFGSPEKVEYYLWMNMSSRELHPKVVANSSLEEQLRDKLFGENGEQAATDAEILAYATDTLGYYGAKHILMLTADMEKPTYGEDGGLTGFESLGEEVVAEKKALAEDLKAQLDAAADPVALFDELMNEYSEDAGLTTNPDGYTASKGQMVESFEQTALSLKEGEISGIVESMYGYHIIMRIPLDPQDYRDSYAGDQMGVMVDEWLVENPIQTNDAYEEIEAAQAAERLFVLQEALYLELYPQEESETPETEAKG